MNSTTGYQSTTAQALMTLSTFAYTEENSQSYTTIKDNIVAYLNGEKGNFSTGTNWELSWLGITQDFDNLLYLAKHTILENTFAFAMRGTDVYDWDNIIQDLNVTNTAPFPYTFPKVDSDICVSQGSIDGLNAMLSTLGSSAGSFDGETAIKIEDFLKSGNFTGKLNQQVPMTIYVTGHSLGGALASAFTSYLIGMFDPLESPQFPYQINIKTYTFASPSLGNQAYADYYNGAPQNTNVSFEGFNVYNTVDVIPYFCANVAGISSNGMPYGTDGIPTFTDELDLALAGIIALLPDDFYVNVGIPQPFTDDISKGTSALPKPIESFEDLGQWLYFEHICGMYLSLVGALPVTDTSSKMISYVPPAIS